MLLTIPPLCHIYKQVKYFEQLHPKFQIASQYTYRCDTIDTLVMFTILSISILLAELQFSSCNFLQAEVNYQKPKLERNNIVNKGVWVKNKNGKLFEKTSFGSFIFRPSSLDADRLLQTNVGTIADNMEETPFVSAFVERARRSTDQMRKRHSRKSLKSKKLKHSIEAKPNEKNLKVTSVFNGYPYEVAILLNNNRKELLNLIDDRNNQTHSNNVTTSTEGNTYKSNVTSDVNVSEATTTETNVSPPKRSRKHNFGIDEPIGIIKDLNKTAVNDNSKSNRDTFDQNDKIWHQNAPIPDINAYEIVPKKKPNAVTEKGLIKVISMLTKTFKKIMKQHNEVKRMQDKFNTMHDSFIKQVNDLNTKFQDFDSKYSDMIQFTDKLKVIEDKIVSEEEYLKTKHKEMDNNIIEFENQQKKFLAQQNQFYTIQKVMLAQNEKIHMKQNTIAKTQSEISHRQNNFARILKKTKQLFIDNRKLINTNNENYAKVTETVNDVKTTVQTTTDSPSTAETIKLNLFSIPAKTELPNQDELIIKEKDEKPIDDLVYKYYFNNTFIDNFMKSKILNHFTSNKNSVDIARNVKNKRDELETTILLPIGNSKDRKNRVRRWINHSKNKKHNLPTKPTNTQVLKMNPEFANSQIKTDPFVTMANSFCNEIGQNTNDQSLKWCIEKALRKLRFLDKKLFSKPVTVMKKKKPQVLKPVVTEKPTTKKSAVTPFPFGLSTVWLATSLDPVSTPLYAMPNQEIFFPDNEELESNLKQYDLTPDTEGNVYYDGSLHFSDIAHENDGMSDLVPELLNSNSQAEMHPIAFDLLSKRRNYVKRLNEDILRRIKSRKL